MLSLKFAMNQITVHQARTFCTCLPSGWMHWYCSRKQTNIFSTLFILILVLTHRADEWPSWVHTCGHHLITRLCKFYYYTMIFYSRITTALWWDFTHYAKLAVMWVICYIIAVNTFCTRNCVTQNTCIHVNHWLHIVKKCQ